MRLHYLFTMVTGLLGLAACQNDDVFLAKKQGALEFYTSTEIDTRTSLQDGNKVVWNEGDAVAVYDFAATKKRFVAEINEGTTHFRGNITPKYGDFIAAYPYDLAAENDNARKIIMYLPEEQTAVKDGFGPDLNLSIAKGSRNVDGTPSEVRFRNICQLFKLSVPEYANGRIAKIQFTANTGICGQLEIDYTDYDPAITTNENGGKTITLLPPSGNTAFAQGIYYLVMAPVEVNGFTLTLTDTQGKTYTQHSNTTLGGIQGFIYNLKNVDLIDVPVVTPQHAYVDGVLHGTNLTLTAPVSDKAWSALVKNASGETVRTLTAGTGTLTSGYDGQDWPYLPKGKYTVEYTYTTANGKGMNATTSFQITENPQFNLTFNASSSYTYYQAGDVDKANTMNANTVTGIVCKATGILPGILADPRYGLALNNTFGGEIAETSDNQATFKDITITTLGKTTLSASLTFDGVTKSVNKDVYITGLPFNHQPPTDDKWDANNGQTSFNGDYVKTGNGGSTGEISFNGVQIPTGTKMTLAYNVYVKMDNALSTQRYQITVGNQIVYNFSTGSAETKDLTGTQDFTNTSEARIVKCYTGYCYGLSHSKTYRIALSYSK